MGVHFEEFGSGQPLLLIHGWGMHGGIWGVAAERLAQDFRVIAVDLPGHGYSREQGTGSRETPHLDVLVDELSARFSEPLNLCGWSLGGQIALRWAQRHPSQVRRLALVASTPCFVQRPGWECAMAEQTLAGFSDSLQQGYAQTLRRFLALQVRGGENERALLVALREALFQRGEPSPEALRAGLDILRDCDLREALPQLALPVLAIAGERDTLTPAAALRYLVERVADARLEVIAGAAHVPFLSHADAFIGCLKGFLDE